MASPGVGGADILTDFIVSRMAGVGATFLFYTLMAGSARLPSA